ncbi:selenoprotein S-like isoform X2 [Euwallacea fornicatus]|uniref:selenoprotein S-like isoform X2 n=1 Tax=Euwallacea fornicatus TaxID=995702 RepID=UPI00338E451F
MDYLREGYQSMVYIFIQIWSIFQTYGWFIFFVGIVMYYAYTKILKLLFQYAVERYIKYRRSKEEAEYTAKYHKDPDLFCSRVSAQQEAAQKLQEKYDLQVKEHQEKLKKKRERKRQELLNLLNEPNNLGHTLGGSEDGSDISASKKSKSLRSEYHPLMGSGNSSNYRPPKKSKCGGGGCGK